jgi:hypothetical protein
VSARSLCLPRQRTVATPGVVERDSAGPLAIELGVAQVDEGHLNGVKHVVCDHVSSHLAYRQSRTERLPDRHLRQWISPSALFTAVSVGSRRLVRGLPAVAGRERLTYLVWSDRSRSRVHPAGAFRSG